MGRMMAGAHYLSDVTLGIVIASGSLIIFYLHTRYGAKYLNRWTGLDMVNGRVGA
jgi:membrane-associated phospholipid phosphatase